MAQGCWEMYHYGHRGPSPKINANSEQEAREKYYQIYKCYPDSIRKVS